MIHAAVMMGLLGLGAAGCSNPGGPAASSSSAGRRVVGAGRHLLNDVTHVFARAPETCRVCSVYENHHDAVVRLRTATGIGTGVVIDDGGSIVTNAHVVRDFDEVLVETYDGTIVRGRVERTHEDADLALIRTSAQEVEWSSLDLSQGELPMVGSTIFVIGHPVDLGWTLTEGIVSGRREAGQIQAVEMLQIDAAVSPGNSGGPVLNLQGEWIGMVSSKLVGPGLENISFVIPVREIQSFLEQE